MTYPAFGLLWYIVYRQRLGLTISLAAMALVLVVAGAAHSQSPLARFFFVDIFGFGGVYLLGTLANAEGDMVSVGSGFPKHLFTLPLSTRALVLWPMAFAAAAIGVVWLLFGRLVLNFSADMDILWWPAAMLVSISTGMQAAMWYPFRRAYLRGLATLFAIAIPLLLACLAWLCDLSPGLLCGIYAAVSIASVGMAYRGVSAARWGGAEERAWALPVPDTLRRDKPLPPFTSSMQAQVWMEWQRNGKMLPLFVGLGCVLSGFLLTILSVLAAVPPVPLGVGSIVASEVARLELLMFPLAVMCAGVVGCCCSRTDTLRRDLTMQPFHATRPLTCAEMVAAKLRMAMLSTLATGTVLAVYLGLWLWQPAQEGSRNAPLGLLLLQHATLRIFVLAVATFCCVPGLIWVALVSGLSIEISGREWLFNLYGVVLPFCAVSTVIGLGYVVQVYPRGLIFIEHAAPYLLSAAVAGKALLALAVCRAVRRRDLVTGASLVRGIMLWCIAVICVVIAAVYALPTGAESLKYIILSVILIAPATRLLSAPLALTWNRTR